jgi:hypothetical protein
LDCLVIKALGLLLNKLIKSGVLHRLQNRGDYRPNKLFLGVRTSCKVVQLISPGVSLFPSSLDPFSFKVNPSKKKLA